MTSSSGYKVSLIKRELEKHFFSIKFSEIKKHPLFQTLNLNNDEIIRNRVEINKVLKNYLICGDNKKFCSTLEPHFTLKRNADNQLIIFEYKCTKWKDHENISPDQISKAIDKSLNSDFFKFEYEEVKLSIEALSDKLQEEIKNIGNREYVWRSRWFNPEFKSKDKFRELYILLSYRAAILGEKIIIIKSSELKHICTQAFKIYEKEEEFINKYQDLLDSENLIISDFGLEDEMNKFNYYLDFFPNLLIKRDSKNKKTYITSKAGWKEIKECILKKKLGTIDNLKCERLEEVVNTIFHNHT